MKGSRLFTPRRGSAAKVVLLALVALVALGAVTLYLLQSDSVPREPAGSVQAEPDVPAQSTRSLESVVPIPTATATATRSAAIPVEVPEEPVAVAEEVDPDDGEGEWVEVLCVLAEGGAPAAQVDVYALALDESLILRLQTAMASGTDIETLVRSVVEPVVTDENGAARVWTLVDRETALMAIGPDLMGYAQPGVQRGRVTIELTADYRMRLLVVDSDGVGVSGAVASARAVFGEQRADLITALTDGEGRADLKLPGQMIGQYTPGTLHVGVRGLFPKPVEQPLDLEAQDTRLELPPFGWALLSPTSADDAQPHVRLVLRATEPGSESATWPEQLEGLTGPDGSLRLGPIALGADLSATGSAVGSPVAWHAEGRGPTVPGETVHLALQRAAAFPLRARALNPAGEPFARALVQARLIEPNASSFRDVPVERLRTDRDGLFTWELPGQTVAGSAALLTVTRRGVDYSAQFAVPVADASGIDLGDLRFDEVPPVAKGRVVDADGTPIARASVQLEHTISNAGIRHTSIAARTRTGADGQFALRALITSGSVDLHVAAEGFVDSHHSLHGPTDVGDVTMAKAGGLRGRVVLGELSVPNLRVGAQTSRGGHFTSLREDGEFSIDGLGTDSWDVFLHGGSLLGGDLLLWNEVDFRAEDGSLDLGEVDLTGRLLRSEVIARNPAGSHLRELYFASVGPTDHFHSRSTAVGEGRHVLLHPPNLSEARVSADGYRTTPITLQAGRQELTLQPALEVVFQVQGAELVPPEVALVLHIVPSDPSQVRRSREIASGPQRMHVDQAGTYRLFLSVSRHGSFHGSDTRGEPHHTVEVLETTVPQEFEFALPAELLAEAQRLTSGD